MAREFKPVRFFVMMVAVALVVCAASAFYTHRATHGRTAPERAAYAIGEKAGEEAPADAKLPTDAGFPHDRGGAFKQQAVGLDSRVGTWPLSCMDTGRTRADPSPGVQTPSRKLGSLCRLQR